MYFIQLMTVSIWINLCQTNVNSSNFNYDYYKPYLLALKRRILIEALDQYSLNNTCDSGIQLIDPLTD